MSRCFKYKYTFTVKGMYFIVRDGYASLIYICLRIFRYSTCEVQLSVFFWAFEVFGLKFRSQIVYMPVIVANKAEKSGI